MDHDTTILVITLSFQLVAIILQVFLRKCGHSEIVQNVARHVSTTMKDHGEEISLLKKSIEPLVDESTLTSLKSLASKIFTITSTTSSSSQVAESPQLVNNIEEQKT